jgi:chorismate lyase/3-hydroxybenzoate synthase
MTQAGHLRSSSLTTLPDLEPEPPRWVQDVFRSTAILDLGPRVHATASGDLVLLKATIARVTRMSVDEMRRRVAETYHDLGSALAKTDRTPIRLWNFIPDLGKVMGPGLDRYMVFNAGRYDALSEPSKAGHLFARSLATASAVGVGGTDLTVYCLVSKSMGQPVENPRQKSAWLYSTRYGPLPPWFSRATMTTIGGHESLLIGGTASIVGEDSRHHVDGAAQLEETLQNLAAVVTAATGTAETMDRALERLLDVRIYVTREDVADIIRPEIERRCPRAAERVELARARLCRPELLLEIEAVAEL